MVLFRGLEACTYFSVSPFALFQAKCNLSMCTNSTQVLLHSGLHLKQPMKLFFFTTHFEYVLVQ